MFTLTLLLLDRGRNAGKVKEIRDVTAEPGLCRERGPGAGQDGRLSSTQRLQPAPGEASLLITHRTQLCWALLRQQTSPSELQAQGSTHRGRHHGISAEQVQAPCIPLSGFVFSSHRILVTGKGKRGSTYSLLICSSACFQVRLARVEPEDARMTPRPCLGLFPHQPRKRCPKEKKTPQTSPQLPERFAHQVRSRSQHQVHGTSS